MSASPSSAARAAEEVARSAYGRLVAYVAASTRDIAAAEDALGDAFLAALRTWPERGVPDHPEAWLLTAARRRLIGAARRESVAERAQHSIALLLDEQEAHRIETEAAAVPDRRLELLFACAHPAIDPGLHAPLMLQTVLGLDAARIGSAFLVAPATMGQRLVRAKAKISEAGIPFSVPAAEDLPARISSVMDAIYAAYGTGWDDPAGIDPVRRGLAEEAIRLARLVTEVLPDEPEAHGLVALLLHSHARTGARRAPDGSFVPLTEQDVMLWSRDEMSEAEHHLALALQGGRPGPYQLQAAIQSLHNRRAITTSTDWAGIAALYDGLIAVTPTVGALVARAAAHAEHAGPETGRALLDELPEEAVVTYQPYWALRAHLLSRVGDHDDATLAARRAIGLADDPAVRSYLLSRFPSASP